MAQKSIKIHLIRFESKNRVNFLPHTTQNLSAIVSRFEPSPLATSNVDFRGLFCRKENDNEPSWGQPRDPKALGTLLGALQMVQGSWQGFSCHKEWHDWARSLEQFRSPAARTRNSLSLLQFSICVATHALGISVLPEARRKLSQHSGVQHYFCSLTFSLKNRQESHLPYNENSIRMMRSRSGRMQGGRGVHIHLQDPRLGGPALIGRCGSVWS